MNITLKIGHRPEAEWCVTSVCRLNAVRVLYEMTVEATPREAVRLDPHVSLGTGATLTFHSERGAADEAGSGRTGTGFPETRGLIQ